jgi:hypothetical protein
MAFNMLVSDDESKTMHGSDDGIIVIRDRRKHARVDWPKADIPDIIDFLNGFLSGDDSTGAAR